MLWPAGQQEEGEEEDEEHEGEEEEEYIELYVDSRIYKALLSYIKKSFRPF